jgi:hypothetical protein
LDVDPEPQVWEDEDSFTMDDLSEREAQQMQDRMEDLLGDLSVFKRKLASDHERFRPVERSGTLKRRRALGAIMANNR